MRPPRLIFLSVFVAALQHTFAFAAGDTSTEPEPPPALAWSWDGPFGTFDRDQLRRGYLVYRDVCANCHSMQLLSFRNLSQQGGPEFSEAEMKAFAAKIKVAAIDEKGEATERAGVAADRFPSPFPNELAARAANGNALPPDLSVIIKARTGGANYAFALLTGYTDPPPDLAKDISADLNYNPYFPGRQLAMAPPLVADDLVTYPPGSPRATSEQMAKDVVAFLSWAAEPTLEERKQLGVKVMVFLAALAVLFFFAYRRLWQDVDH